MHTQMSSYHNKTKLSVNHIHKKYDNHVVLEDISFKVQEGEFISIVGASGSGKSTIFNIITQLVEADCGEVQVDGKISYMQQKDLLLPYKTILENASLPLLLKKVPKKEAFQQVKPYFSAFGLDGYEEKYPRELSGGMKQRANFLRTFINSNDVMLLDEPFGALDSITKTKMQQWLLDVKKQFRSTIVLITHDIEEAIYLSDRIYVLSNKPATIQATFELADKEKYEFGSKEYIQLKKDIIQLLG